MNVGPGVRGVQLRPEGDRAEHAPASAPFTMRGKHATEAGPDWQLGELPTHSSASFYLAFTQGKFLFLRPGYTSLQSRGV